MHATGPATAPHKQEASMWASATVHLAVIDVDGKIVAVNSAWRQFAAENGAPAHAALIEGADYFAGSAAAATAGVCKVLSGELDVFRHEYPYDSLTERRWCQVCATPLPEGVLIAHTTIVTHPAAVAA